MNGFRESDYPVINRVDEIAMGRARDQWWTYDIPDNHDWLLCPDGFRVSAQASKSHYCHPRDNYGPYMDVELGFPRGLDKRDREELKSYWENIGRPMEESVFGWVPVTVLRDIIVRHCMWRSAHRQFIAIGLVLILLTLLIAYI